MPSFTITNRKQKDFEILYDRKDTELLAQFNWLVTNSGYAATSGKKPSECRNLLFLHRIILDADPEKEVDHINGNRLDNRRKNLRVCSRAENARNIKTHKDNKSGYKGVTKKREKWAAQIMQNKKLVYLGVFQTREEAAVAYNKHAVLAFGEFARQNIV